MDPAVAPAPSSVSRLVAHARQELARYIIGQQSMLEDCLAGVLVGGHVLLEGVPGLAKTLTVKSLGALLALTFQRVQGTSDLMPTDLLGTNVFNQATASFQLHRGPLFADIVLVDEINRMPPRTQAALLEAMEERQITIDGKRYPLSATFTVFATQNPVEFEGTYPLPEAQLDRFLLKVVVPYPETADEVRMLELFHGSMGRLDVPAALTPLPQELLEEARREIAAVLVEPNLLRYVVEFARATRNSPQVFLGASPRASSNLLYVGKAYAAMDGRNYLLPDDIKRALLPVLRHRVVLNPEAQREGLTPDQVLTDLVRAVAVPK